MELAESDAQGASSELESLSIPRSESLSVVASEFLPISGPEPLPVISVEASPTSGSELLPMMEPPPASAAEPLPFPVTESLPSVASQSEPISESEPPPSLSVEPSPTSAAKPVLESPSLSVEEPSGLTALEPLPISVPEILTVPETLILSATLPPDASEPMVPVLTVSPVVLDSTSEPMAPAFNVSPVESDPKASFLAVSPVTSEPMSPVASEPTSEPMALVLTMSPVASESIPSVAIRPSTFTAKDPCSETECPSETELLSSTSIEPIPSAPIFPIPPDVTEPSSIASAKLLPSEQLSSIRTEAPPLPPSELSVSPVKEPSFSGFVATDTNDKQLVSSVDGEPVLIVEGLGLETVNIPAVDGNSTGKLESLGEQQEAGKEVKPVRFYGDGEALKGCKVHKRFGKKYFRGEVIGFDPELKWYKVAYEDGDEEELDWGELETLLHSVSNASLHSAKKRPRGSNDTGDDLKRDPKRGKKVGRPRTTTQVDELKAGTQITKIQEQKVEKKAVGRDADPIHDEAQPLGIIEKTFDAHEQQTDSIGSEKKVISDGKQRGWRKRRAEESPKLGRRSKSGRKSDAEEDTTPQKLRLRSRQKAELDTRGQETAVEHKIATRSSTGSLGSPPDSTVRLRKVEESQDKDKLESDVSMISPIGGGARIIGRKTRKDFGGQVYIGEVVGYDPRAKYYKVQYEDGDEEELEWSELMPTLISQEEQFEGPSQTGTYVKKWPRRRLKEHSRRIRSLKSKQRPLILYDGRVVRRDLPIPSRRWRKRVRTASVSGMMKGNEDWAAAPATHLMASSRAPPRPLAAVRFASASDADIFEYFGWGEAVNFDKTKCPELRAARLLPTSSPVVHLAASHHHLAAITATGQVWVWRNKHGNIHTRCNEWEHVSTLEEKGVILVDISGPDVDRTSAGYEPEQEDQVPDPFYLAAVCRNGEDIILQGSQPHELVHTYQLGDEPRHPGVKEALLQSNCDSLEDAGRIVQVSVGTVEAPDESPFMGYITDTDHVYIRSATRDFMEEVNLVTGYTGRPIKIQCGRVYHAIIMTDDGRAWTWGRGYYPGSNGTSSGSSSKWSSPFSVCQPAVGTLVGRKVVDVGCYGEDFIALTNDGDIHQWTHALPNPAAGVYNVPATPIYGQGPCIAAGDKLKQVSIGAGMCAGISEAGKVHTWRTSMKGGLMGVVSSEREALTPLGRDEGYKDTTISSLGPRIATKVICVAGSLIVVVKRKSKSRRGGRKKSDLSLTEKGIGGKNAAG